MQRETLDVTGMSCNGCEKNVEDALRNVAGVNRVEADNERDSVDIVLEETVPDEDIHAAIEQAGYDVAV